MSRFVNNERIYAFAKPYTWNEVLAIMRVACPSREFPGDLLGVQRSNLKVPSKRGEELLKAVFGRDGWTTFEETILKNLEGLV